MLRELHNLLYPLCRRERSWAMVTRIAQGLTLGAVLALVIGLIGWVTASSLARTIGFVVLGVGVIGGIILATRVGKDWVAAARAVDRHFGLADRTLTALACASTTPPRPIDQLQVRDTVARLEQVDPREALTTPFPWQGLVTAVAVGILAVIILLAGGRGDGARAGSPRIDEAVFLRSTPQLPEVTSRYAERSLRATAPAAWNGEDRGWPADRPISDAQIRRYFEAVSAAHDRP